MAGELIAQLNRGDWFRETSLGYESRSYSVIVPPTAASPETAGGNLCGMTINKVTQSVASGSVNPVWEFYNSIVLIPSSLTMATGLTWKFRLTDDGTSPADLGLVVQLGLSVFNMDNAGFLCSLPAAAGGTEVTGNVTLSVNPGAVVTGSIALLAANLGGAVVGSMIVVRFRRTNAAADTCPGRVVMLTSEINNT